MHGIGYITGYPGSYVLAAPSLPPTSALIFVHGFGGDSVGTWQHAPEPVDVSPYDTLLASSDLFFYDYQCTRNKIEKSADRLNEFITQILTHRSSVRTGRPPYQTVHLMGHSAGAVVIRQLMLELVKPSKQSPFSHLLLDSNPVLFGSAHSGFQHSMAVMLILQRIPFLDVAVAVWLLKRGSVYPDLQHDSKLLSTLEEQTKDLWATAKVPAFRPLLAWGKDEQVVNVLDYLRDIRIAYKAQRDHFSICKPKRQDADALQWITTAMKEIPANAAPR
jgi:pimeloyl-ACP methyl ester carboxylesterase